MAHPAKEASTLLLKAVLVFLAASVLAGFLIAAPRPLHAKRNVGVHEDGQIRLQIATKNVMKLEHRPASQLAPGALVSLGRIGESVAQHDFAGAHPRLDHLSNM